MRIEQYNSELSPIAWFPDYECEPAAQEVAALQLKCRRFDSASTSYEFASGGNGSKMYSTNVSDILILPVSMQKRSRRRPSDPAVPNHDPSLTPPPYRAKHLLMRGVSVMESADVPVGVRYSS